MPYALWRMKTKGPTLFLTFDDGPTPGVTEPILEALKDFNAKATFFCLGKQAMSHPSLMRMIRDEGHAIGNHTHSHLNGWEVSRKDYLKDVFQAEEVLAEVSTLTRRLFRPPFGRSDPLHWLALRHSHQFCMWDVTGQDFLEGLDAFQVEANVVDNSTNGSIILLHDSELAAPRVLNALPEILAKLGRKGFAFDAIDLRQ